MRSLRDLTQHLTARADDSHAAPVQQPLREVSSLIPSPVCQTWVRFFALHRIKPHAPLLVRVPVNSFEFQPCGRSPQADHLTRWLRYCLAATASDHRLGLGLPGYLILFAPPAFVFQRREYSRGLPSPLVFLSISTHSTATPKVPSSFPIPKAGSIHSRSTVKP